MTLTPVVYHQKLSSLNNRHLSKDKNQEKVFVKVNDLIHPSMYLICQLKLSLFFVENCPSNEKHP